MLPILPAPANRTLFVTALSEENVDASVPVSTVQIEVDNLSSRRAIH
jgi:hypothetical protein